MGSPTQDAARSAQQTARQIARQLAREPLEMGRVAQESLGIRTPTELDTAETSVKTVGNQEKIRLEMKRKRLLQALESELADIRRDKEIKAAEIQRQEDQKQQQQQTRQAQAEPLRISSKPGRMLSKIKKHVQNLTKSTETRQPPTG